MPYYTENSWQSLQLLRDVQEIVNFFFFFFLQYVVQHISQEQNTYPNCVIHMGITYPSDPTGPILSSIFPFSLVFLEKMSILKSDA